MTQTLHNEREPVAPRASDDLELTMKRTFDAPRALVFRAWIDPEMGRQWAGPRGFTGHPSAGAVPAPGVAWRTLLRSDDGSMELWQGGVYREVIEPERLVFTFAWEGDDGLPEHEMLVTITFIEHDGKTEMTFHQAFFASKESRDNHRGGWSSAFDRLEDLVAPDGSYVITRLFAAPRELVFDAWTHIEHLAKWFGPPGYDLVNPTLELRPGGHFRYGLSGPDSNLSCTWTFREIVRPERLALIVAFTDAAGASVRHPMQPNWPLLTDSVVTFEDRLDGTLLVLRKTPIDATDAEMAAFVASFEGMNGGWTPAFEKLERYLKTVASS